MQSIERFQIRYILEKQFSDNILLRFQWQNFKGWQLPDFFGPGFNSMSPWYKRSKANWQAYIHIATEELLSDILNMNSLAKFSSEISLKLVKHKTHKTK